MTEPSVRKQPNILITGTPGTGKTCTASLLAERLHLHHISVGDVIAEHKCYTGRDEELDTYILDEEKLLDILEPIMDELCFSSSCDDDDHDNDDDGSRNKQQRGVVVDYHASDLFPERWFDLVLVLQCETSVLFDRLEARQYSTHKRTQNMESEILHVALEEARDAYDPNIVHVIPSNNLDDMESTIQRVQLWMEQWMRDHHHTHGNKKETDDIFTAIHDYDDEHDSVDS